ncbi:MAG: acyltransferase [Duncaniella sp.]|nr:acyltransferase [Duncaniella sp.]
MNPTTALLDKSAHIGWIDYAKSYAIFTVVLVHTHCSEFPVRAIRFFAIPLFFFLAGFLFSRRHNPEFKPFAIKRFRQLVIPYVWINIVAYIAWFTVTRHYGSSSGDALAWHEPLWAMTLGIPRRLAHDIPLWSLLCFFVVEIIYYLLPSRGRWGDLIIAAVAYLVACAVNHFGGASGVDLPLTLAPAAAALAFYALGHFVRLNSSRFTLLFAPSLWMLLAGVALLVAGVWLNYPMRASFYIGVLGNPLCYLAGACGGIIAGVQIAAMLEALFHDGALARLISRGTLIICGFHLLALSLIKGVMYFGFGFDPDALTDGLLRGVAVSIVAIALCIPLIIFIERHLRFLVSK